MRVYKEFFYKIVRVRQDLKSLKSLGDFTEYLSSSFFTKISLCILLAWVISPIWIIINSSLLSNKFKNLSSFMKRVEIDIIWYVFLQQLGYIAFIIFIFVIIKNYNDLKIHKFNYKNLIKINQVEILLIFMLVWSIISTLVSSDMNLSFTGTSYRHDGLNTYITYAGFFTCGYYINTKSSIKKIISIFVLSSTIVAGLVLLDINYLNNIFSFNTNSAIFYNINHYGYYLCMAVISSVFLVLTNKSNKKNKHKYLLCYVLLVAVLVKNNSFGPYLATLVGLSVQLVIIYYNFRDYFKDMSLIFILFLVISLVINMFSSFLIVEVLKLFGDVQEIVTNDNLSEQAGSGRWILWKNGIKYMLEKPIFGYGPDNLGYRYAMDKIQQDRPHNEFIQIAASLGIPALFFYITALYKHFRLVTKNIKHFDIELISLNLVVATYLFSSFFGNTMFYTSPYYFIFLGMAVSNTKLVINCFR
ncbi:O-antigen ligase [Acetoanaerobium noterae]|uniref:O-antigen ligase n=1 Tax=Acetoanaerobium noterae TaxID=745369 RepID=A0A1T5AS57_9FIRM|nr:O-antigen ligase family protein [Acetoanaerobium noterae]SKB37699.1 O-antigen ligase [Acetoanaerobium noterae]